MAIKYYFVSPLAVHVTRYRHNALDLYEYYYPFRRWKKNVAAAVGTLIGNGEHAAKGRGKDRARHHSTVSRRHRLRRRCYRFTFLNSRESVSKREISLEITENVTLIRRHFFFLSFFFTASRQLFLKKKKKKTFLWESSVLLPRATRITRRPLRDQSSRTFPNVPAPCLGKPVRKRKHTSRRDH